MSSIVINGFVGVIGQIDGLADVFVACADQTLDTSSDSTGAFDLTVEGDEFSDSYDLTFSKPGYVTAVNTVFPRPQGSTQIRPKQFMTPGVLTLLDQLFTYDVTTETDVSAYVGATLETLVATLLFDTTADTLTYSISDVSAIVDEGVTPDDLLAAMIEQLGDPAPWE